MRDSLNKLKAFGKKNQFEIFADMLYEKKVTFLFSGRGSAYY